MMDTAEIYPIMLNRSWLFPPRRESVRAVFHEADVQAREDRHDPDPGGHRPRAAGDGQAEQEGGHD
jgi:hypothetical protein